MSRARWAFTRVDNFLFLLARRYCREGGFKRGWKLDICHLSTITSPLHFLKVFTSYKLTCAGKTALHSFENIITHI